MYPIEILFVKVENNLCKIESMFEFEVLYEVKMILEIEFELRVIYITSPSDQSLDQELELFRLPANKLGKFKVFLKTQPPDYKKIKKIELTEISLILLVVSYEKKELIRIGYYLTNEFISDGQYETNESSENPIVIRKILSDKPRITYFPLFYNYSS